MVQIQTIFFDDGGVLNDNAVREPQWQDLIAQYFAPQYGGDHDAWKQANRVALENLVKRWRKAKENPKMDFQSYWQKEMALWITTMFHHVGISPPPSRERWNIARKAEEWVTPKVRAAFPGVIKTICHLKERGYALYTASNETSWTLRGYLTGMGIVDCFEELYGADLINTIKASPLFYERMFRHAGIKAEQALVVDDFQENVLWANEVGATGVLVAPSSNEIQPNLFYSIKRLNHLPSLLHKIVHNK